MLRALFSKRYLQQLLREGKLLNERIYLYSTLIFLFIFPNLVLIFVELTNIEINLIIHNPLQLYAIVFAGFLLFFGVSRFFLWYFTMIFNYQEQRVLYLSLKALYCFCNALLFFCLLPVVWYTRTIEVIYFVYFPLFIILFFAFFIHFLRNVNGITRIHFFIYFCSLEILPYLLLLKLLIIKL